MLSLALNLFKSNELFHYGTIIAFFDLFGKQ